MMLEAHHVMDCQPRIAVCPDYVVTIADSAAVALISQRLKKFVVCLTSIFNFARLVSLTYRRGKPTLLRGYVCWVRVSGV